MAVDFDGSQVLIGRGAQADVFEYKGYAYKVYKPSYPSEWIAFEKDQQKAVNGAGLSPIRYYDTDDDHIIKMDLISGVMLETKMKNGFDGGFEVLATAFRKVHAADPDGIRMPRLIDTAGMGFSDEEKDQILPIIDRLSGKYDERICHLDMHFQNIMFPNDGGEPVIIDWMNTRIAPVIFDYARTYVILEEFAKEIIPYYMAAISDDISSFPKADLDDAIKVCSVIRKHEKD